MDNENGLYLGINTKSSNPIILDSYSKDKNPNWILTGTVGKGNSVYHKMRILELVQVQNLVNNHLNNNNWLKQHGKPMIRKGHPLYSECKKHKGKKPFEIVVIDTEQEYKSMSKILSNDVLKFQKGDREQINIHELN